jgi:hypothetical protein
MNIRIMLAIAMLSIGCNSQPASPHDIIIKLDTGSKIVQISPDTCEGKWNFCDQVLREQDDLDSYMIPAF